MHDGIALESRGVPTATLITDLFERAATTMAGVCGMPDYAIVYIKHPLANLTPEQARARGDTALSEVVRVLSEAPLAVRAR